MSLRPEVAERPAAPVSFQQSAAAAVVAADFEQPRET
jgi:hypothetical protein